MSEKQPQPPVAWRQKGGLQLTNLNDAWRFAQAVIRSGLAPKGMESPEKVLVAMQMGAELGVPPLAALQNIAVINGRPYVSCDLMLAVVRASGLFDESAFHEQVEETESGPVATCTVRRLPDGKPITRRFSLADARRAGLIRRDSAWEKYPLRMVQLRARAWALRDAFADVLRGLRPAEDVDAEPVRVEVVDQQPVPLTRDAELDVIAHKIGGTPPQDEHAENEAEPERVTSLLDESGES